MRESVVAGTIYAEGLWRVPAPAPRACGARCVYRAGSGEGVLWQDIELRSGFGIGLQSNGIYFRCTVYIAIFAGPWAPINSPHSKDGQHGADGQNK